MSTGKRSKGLIEAQMRFVSPRNPIATDDLPHAVKLATWGKDIRSSQSQMHHNQTPTEDKQRPDRSSCHPELVSDRLTNNPVGKIPRWRSLLRRGQRTSGASPIKYDVRVTLDTHQSHRRCKIVSTPPSTGDQTLPSSVVHFERHASTGGKFVSPRAISVYANASERLSNPTAAV